MSLEDDLTGAFVNSYHDTGVAVGYWANRFLQAVKKDGGLATAKRMLLPRNVGQRKGLDALLEANRPELTIEAIVLQPKFRQLFTKAEISVAQNRLGEYGKAAAAYASNQDNPFPNELRHGPKYSEGSKNRILVNAYERSRPARNACLKHYGFNCVVCGFNFEERYGELGKGFMHVHHLKSLALTDGKYKLDPVADLRPVCPNCHAMLHRGPAVLAIEELFTRLQGTGFNAVD